MRTLLLCLLLAAPSLLFAQMTWTAVEKLCPIDGAKCSLLEPDAPPPPQTQATRFDALESPFAEPNAWYQCQSCGFAAYMKDFHKLEGDQVRKALLIVAKVDKPDQVRSYNMTKFSDRLERAQLFFPVFGRNTDHSFQADFCRLKGYAYELENNPGKATEARQQARIYTTELIKDGKNAGLLREYLWELAALDYRLGDSKTALENLERASKLRYNSQLLKQNQNEKRNRELDDMITELQHRIENAVQQAGEQKLSPKTP